MNILSHLNTFLSNSSSIVQINNKANYLGSPLLSDVLYRETASLVEIIADFSYQLARSLLKYIFEKADEEFRNSQNRTDHYYVKDTRERTIITIFGQLTYKRTIYQNRDTKKYFCYVDRKFGIPKYDQYDPCVKSMIYESYANNNSMIKVGQIIGDRIFSPFSLSKDRIYHAIPRQTVQNILKSHSALAIQPASIEAAPDTLYVMADEKWIALQSHDENKEKERQMVKAAISFEDVALVKGHKKRNQLVNRNVFFGTGSNFWNSIYDQLCSIYDMNSIKHIWVLGDGANWIKNGTYVFRSDSTRSSFSLDKFHFKQALRRISKDKDIYGVLCSACENNDKKLFKETVEVLLEDETCPRDTIETNRDYILSNWSYIQNTYQSMFMPCSMESGISHHICSQFTSVPKAYIRENLSKYLSLRESFINGYDLRNMYIQSVGIEPNDKGVIDLAEEYDFSMFDKKDRGIKSTIEWLIDHKTESCL